MARITDRCDTEDLPRYIHERNMECSRALLEALVASHGTPEALCVFDEPLPVATEPPPPEPQMAPVVIPDFEESVFIPTNKIEVIKRKVCKHFTVTKAGIESNSRRAAVVRPRQIAMYLARRHTTHSFPEIGRRFGGRDHTTILHAFHKIEGLIQTDAALAATVAELEASIA